MLGPLFERRLTIWRGPRSGNVGKEPQKTEITRSPVSQRPLGVSRLQLFRQEVAALRGGQTSVSVAPSEIPKESRYKKFKESTSNQNEVNLFLQNLVDRDKRLHDLDKLLVQPAEYLADILLYNFELHVIKNPKINNVQMRQFMEAVYVQISIIANQVKRDLIANNLDASRGALSRYDLLPHSDQVH